MLNKAFSKLIPITISAFILAALPAVAFAEQPDPGDDNPQAVLNGATLSEVLGTAPTLQSPLMASPATTIWNVHFAANMTDGQVAHGLDISEWDGASNDFAAAKAAGLEFAIIRCGYGNDYTSQDDKYWINNIRGARDNGIPFGVYIYSYATNTTMARSEAAHVIRQLNNIKNQLGITPADITYPIYFDFEDGDQSNLSKSEVKAIVDAFAQAIKSDATWGSCAVGHYSMRSWALDSNRLGSLSSFTANGKTYSYSRWIAEFGTNNADTYHALHDNSGNAISPSATCDIWQVCSSGKSVAGIDGGDASVDVDFAYKTFAADITGSMGKITVDTAAKTYTGAAITPSVSVVYGTSNGTTLVKGTDYTVSYSNNVNAGTGKITVTGIGKYKGSKTYNFTINARSITQATVGSVVDQVETGSTITPKPTVTYNGKTLAEGTDYSLSYKNNIEPGQATITITGSGNWTGSTTASFNIEARDVDIAEVNVEGVADAVWTGWPIEPAVRVSFANEVLAEGSDYSVSYGANTDVGQGTVTITGLGKYHGSRTETFNITARNIQDAESTSAANQTFTGDEITPEISLSYDGQALVPERDYVLSYDGNVHCGNATITVTGAGGYTGQKQISFTIVAANIRDATFDPIPTASAATLPACPTVSGAFNGHALSDTDYTLSYTDNNRVGRAYAVVSGQGDFTGQVRLPFDIAAVSIADAEIAGIPNVEWTGSAHTPAVSLTYEGSSLAEGTDYTASYSNNVNVGSALITITGAGRFAGSTTYARFDITARDIKTATVSAIPTQAWATYTRPKPAVSWKGQSLRENTDYTLSYAGDDKPGTATLTVTGIGGYTGQVNVSYEIAAPVDPEPDPDPDPINIALATVAPISNQVYTGSAVTPALHIRYQGQDLVANADYTVSYAKNTSVGTATATVKGAGKYSGSTTISFQITARNINDAKAATIADVEMTGMAIEPSVSLTYGGKSLVKNTDYTAVYSNNVNVGTASIKITGKGNWTGSRTLSFKIVAGSPIYCEDVLGAASGKPFEIMCEGAPARVVDIAGNSDSSGANIHLWQPYRNTAQRFIATFHKVSGKTGYYTFEGVKSAKNIGCVGTIKVGANVAQQTKSSAAGQRWALVDYDHDGKYSVVSCSGKISWMASGSTNGSNISLAALSTSAFQDFAFTSNYKTLAVGTYRIESTVNRNYAVDVAGGSMDKCANIQLWHKNYLWPQSFKFTYDAKTGYYTITNAKNKKVIDVRGVGTANGTNIWQFDANGCWAQKWTVEKNSNGTYTFRAPINGSAFDLDAMRAFAGNNIQLWEYNGCNAQRWWLVKI